MTSKNSSPVQEYRNNHAVRFGGELLLKSNHRPCFNARIFLNLVRTVFLPYLFRHRDLGAFAEEIAVLLMDE
jgi:hypothetical protein